jgi:FkbM family methyltransferase
VGGLATATIRRLGKITAKYPWTRGIARSAYQVFTPSVTTIREGRAAGLKIRTRGANPGYRFGTTEPAVQEALADALAPGDVFYDLGANVGFFTLIAAKAVGPTGHVHAFEPEPETAAELRANVALNSLGQVQVHEVAITDSVGEAKLTNSKNKLRSRLDQRGTITVPTTMIDALDLPPPNLVKIDVEGAESRAIAGMRRTIRESQPTLLCEMHIVGTVKRASQMLEEWLPGYSVKPLEPSESDHVWAPHLLATPIAPRP